MELGQRVKFKKEFKKGENLSYSDNLYYKYEDGLLWGTIEHKEELEGIICGKRTIGYKGRHGEYGDFIAEEYKEVYLVANTMRGFHRVPKQWIKEG